MRHVHCTYFSMHRTRWIRCTNTRRLIHSSNPSTHASDPKSLQRCHLTGSRRAPRASPSSPALLRTGTTTRPLPPTLLAVRFRRRTLWATFLLTSRLADLLIGRADIQGVVFVLVKGLLVSFIASPRSNRSTLWHGRENSPHPHRIPYRRCCAPLPVVSCRG